MYTLLVTSLDRFCPGSITKEMIELSGVNCSPKLQNWMWFLLEFNWCLFFYISGPLKYSYFDNIYLTPIQTVTPEDFFPPTFLRF